jgi:hypothetical protein
MLVKNEILWYKLSIRRIEFSALSDANGGEKRGDRRHVSRMAREGEKFYLNRV